MYKFLLERWVPGKMRGYPPKVFKQVAAKVFVLGFNPRPHDSKRVSPGCRVDVGEYWIFYQVDDEARMVNILVIGKRSNDETYRLIRRLGFLWSMAEEKGKPLRRGFPFPFMLAFG